MTAIVQWKKLKESSLANATSVLKPAYGEAAALASTFCDARHAHTVDLTPVPTTFFLSFSLCLQRSKNSHGLALAAARHCVAAVPMLLR